MIRSFLLACALAAPVPAAAGPAGPVGLADLAVPAPHHDRTIEAVVWYPAAPAAAAPAEAWGGNAVFHGHAVHRDAAPAGPDAPVVLLSHGLGGNLRGLGWLAHGLAARGAVVVALDHPGSTTRDLDPARSLDHGTRARDLSAALNALGADPRFADRTGGPVTAAGFSLGGWTALSLGGLRGDLAGYAAHCDAVGGGSTHCADIAGWGIDLHALDASRWDGDHADPRVTRVAAIDPGLVWGLPDRGGLRAETLLIALGDGPDRLLATDFDRSGLRALLPGAATARVAPARHWSALPRCRPGGAAIVAAETDLPICDDPPGADRAAIHARIVDLVAGLALRD
ncbi:hypothetical protein JQC91_03075 [Jannaschia sp. Os4]|uniref:alpha/beta hydrolase family protein n=1 Tax=Jannaschia sp. Os4 TaxID=2807617 RepID=UPI00193A4979|nr:hypothetical protein [Jannaschia sp. Os4]MBM2575278.1 hypothetical protein [Jannaschia sp. Os4]